MREICGDYEIYWYNFVITVCSCLSGLFTVKLCNGRSRPSSRRSQQIFLFSEFFTAVDLKNVLTLIRLIFNSELHAVYVFRCAISRNDCRRARCNVGQVVISIGMLPDNVLLDLHVHQGITRTEIEVCLSTMEKRCFCIITSPEPTTCLHFANPKRQWKRGWMSGQRRL